ncbi:MAG: OmpA family protein [Opitutales bacterium]|nr:OmpA family protein [Opitutales bacterium]
MTVTRGDGENSSDWINAAEVYGAGAAGLEVRDGAFGEDGERITGVLPSVYFDFDTSYIKQSERTKLAQAVEHLKNNPNDRLLIEGNCDWRGTKEYNLALGDRRAESVLAYLSGIGVDTSRVQTVSLGDLNAAENSAESQMSQDRRADLVIIRK